jgi:hypothetical protein
MEPLAHMGGLNLYKDGADRGMANMLFYTWNERHQGPWDVVHEKSSNMTKQKWLWDAYSSAAMPSASFKHPGTVAQFPYEGNADAFWRLSPSRVLKKSFCEAVGV